MVRMGVAKRRRKISAMERCIHFPPFLIHVALVLTVGWIASLWSLNLPFVFTVGFAYLYFVEGRLKAKFESRIRSEERKVHDRKRLLSDAETARWLNSTVEAVWPIFMENFASQRFLMPIAPWFLEKYKPGITKKVVLQKICLGRNPPVFTMLRCGRNPTDGDHLVLEMGMKFVAAGDMSALIAVQMRKRVGFGIWTSLNISNVQIEGKLRVGVRFTKGWPVVERLRVAFSEAPILQMTAKPIFNYGIDVTDLPGVAGWVDKMIADALEQSLVEPNMLVVDVKSFVGSMMPVNAMVQPTRGASLANPGDFFSVMNPKLPLVGILRVEILDGKKMKPSDPNGKADPYVKLQLGSTKYTTSIKHRTLQPAWYETFEFPIQSWDQPNKLQLRVLDKDRFGQDDDMGFAEIDCQSFNDGQRHEMELILDRVKTGQLRIAITSGDVPGAENVPTDLDTLQSFNAEYDSSSLAKKLKNFDSSKGVSDSQRQVDDQELSETDDEECSIKGDTQVVDVGYGKPGAVSIVTPGKVEVKEATSVERLRRRRKIAVSKAQNMAHKFAHPSDPSPPGVADEGKRSRLKKLFRGKERKSTSQSDSSGELVVIAQSDKGTIVQTTVEVSGEVCKNDKPAHIVPSSGDLLQGSEEALDEVRPEKGGKSKVQIIMHRISKKANTVTSAISKMRSPSGKKRSLSGKNLGEELASKDHEETHDVAETSTTGELMGDEKVILQHESPSSTQAQGITVTVVETGEEFDNSEAETGKCHQSRDSFSPSARLTTPDQHFPSNSYPDPPREADHIQAKSIPTSTSASAEESSLDTATIATPDISLRSKNSALEDDIFMSLRTKDDPNDDGVDVDNRVVLPSCEDVGKDCKTEVNSSRLFSESTAEGNLNFTPLAPADKQTEVEPHSAAPQRSGEERPVGYSPAHTGLANQSTDHKHFSEENTPLHSPSDPTYFDIAFTTETVPSTPPSRHPPELRGRTPS
ncbi:hypothetical protein Mapa_015164 [Marchantia paleacea]|nr:hypothetical protein Mapa_015164 [Marchantia paleacea]